MVENDAQVVGWLANCVEICAFFFVGIWAVLSDFFLKQRSVVFFMV